MSWLRRVWVGVVDRGRGYLLVSCGDELWYLFMLRTNRLVLREAEAADLEDMHRVFASDPKLVEIRPDIAAEGGYDLASVRRYWEVALLDPVRHVLVIERHATGEVIGVLDFVTESPTDGFAWIGLLLIHGDHQRRGLGAEALGAVTEHLAEAGHTAVRMAVMEGNEVGLEFALRMGFAELAEAPTMATERRALVMGLDLVAPR